MDGQRVQADQGHAAAAVIEDDGLRLARVVERAVIGFSVASGGFHAEGRCDVAFREARLEHRCGRLRRPCRSGQEQDQQKAHLADGNPLCRINNSHLMFSPAKSGWNGVVYIFPSPRSGGEGFSFSPRPRFGGEGLGVRGC